jgi:hypothetical protein
MVAAINNVVGAVGIALLARSLRPSSPTWLHGAAGVVGALILTWVFYVYQRWRFDDYEARALRRVEGTVEADGSA